MNNKYIIRFEHPLVRPGITIVTEVSERYVVAVIQKSLDIIRELNTPKEEPGKGGKP